MTELLSPEELDLGPNLVLTDEEVEHILQRREDNVHQRRLDGGAYALSVAESYARWLLNNANVDDTYSTFCDDYGFEPRESVDRLQLYSLVSELMNVAGWQIEIWQK